MILQSKQKHIRQHTFYILLSGISLLNLLLQLLKIANRSLWNLLKPSLRENISIILKNPLTACRHCAKIPKAKPIFPCNIGFTKRNRACAERLKHDFAQKYENDYQVLSNVR